MLRMVLQNNQLPSIVQDFLKHADNLRKLLEKATLEIVGDIRSMLYDQESTSSRTQIGWPYIF